MKNSPQQIWKTMSAKDMRQLAIAVFFLFGTIGPLTMLMDARIFPNSWSKFLLLTLSSGLFSASIIMFIGKPKRLFVSIIIFISFTMVSSLFEKQLFTSEALQRKVIAEQPITFTAAELDAIITQRTVFGLTAIAMLSIGYALFIRVIAKINKRRAEVEAEINITQNIQRSLLPQSATITDWCEIEGTSLTATEVGGDYFDIITLSDDEILVVIADASGHGAGAGILAAMTKSGILQELQHTTSPAKILSSVNNMIVQVSEKKMFVTCALVLLSKKYRNAIVATAGHPAVLHHTENSLHEIRTPNVALGLMPNIQFDELKIQITSQDEFILYTDGVTEATNERGEEFGIEGFKSLILQNEMLAINSDSIVGHIKTFSKELKDDATVVCVAIHR